MDKFFHDSPMQLGFATGMGFHSPWFGLTILVIFWLFSIKGLALWYAAKHSDRGWFIALMIINTFGLLELFYLFFVLKMKLNELW